MPPPPPRPTRSSASASADPPTKPPVTLHPTTTIDASALLTGTFPISIGANTIIHPKARLNSTHGPITIGASCIISERCLLQAADPAGLIVGEGVLVECNAVVEGREIGIGTDVEVGVRVGRGAVVGKHCKLCPMTEVAEQEVLPDYTVIYGYNERRTDASGSEGPRRKFLDKHIDVLKMLLTSNPGKFKT